MTYRVNCWHQLAWTEFSCRQEVAEVAPAAEILTYQSQLDGVGLRKQNLLGVFLTGKLTWKTFYKKFMSYYLRHTLFQAPFCLYYLIPLALIISCSTTSRNIKLIGWVSILLYVFCLLFVSWHHVSFIFWISCQYLMVDISSKAPRFPLYFPVSVILKF